MMKAAAAQRGRQQWRNNKDRNGGVMMKGATAQ
jgi:hypothetical protein